MPSGYCASGKTEPILKRCNIIVILHRVDIIVYRNIADISFLEVNINIIVSSIAKAPIIKFKGKLELEWLSFRKNMLKTAPEDPLPH